MNDTDLLDRFLDDSPTAQTTAGPFGRPVWPPASGGGGAAPGTIVPDRDDLGRFLAGDHGVSVQHAVDDLKRTQGLRRLVDNHARSELLWRNCLETSGGIERLLQLYDRTRGNPVTVAAWSRFIKTMVPVTSEAFLTNLVGLTGLQFMKFLGLMDGASERRILQQLQSAAVLASDGGRIRERANQLGAMIRNRAVQELFMYTNRDHLVLLSELSVWLLAQTDPAAAEMRALCAFFSRGRTPTTGLTLDSVLAGVGADATGVVQGIVDRISATRMKRSRTELRAGLFFSRAAVQSLLIHYTTAGEGSPIFFPHPAHAGSLWVVLFWAANAMKLRLIANSIRWLEVDRRAWTGVSLSSKNRYLTSILDVARFYGTVPAKTKNAMREETSGDWLHNWATQYLLMVAYDAIVDQRGLKAEAISIVNRGGEDVHRRLYRWMHSRLENYPLMQDAHQRHCRGVEHLGHAASLRDGGSVPQRRRVATAASAAAAADDELIRETRTTFGLFFAQFPTEAAPPWIRTELITRTAVRRREQPHRMSGGAARRLHSQFRELHELLAERLCAMKDPPEPTVVNTVILPRDLTPVELADIQTLIGDGPGAWAAYRSRFVFTLRSDGNIYVRDGDLDGATLLPGLVAPTDEAMEGEEQVVDSPSGETPMTFTARQHAAIYNSLQVRGLLRMRFTPGLSDVYQYGVAKRFTANLMRGAGQALYTTSQRLGGWLRSRFAFQRPNTGPLGDLSSSQDREEALDFILGDQNASSLVDLLLSHMERHGSFETPDGFRFDSPLDRLNEEDYGGAVRSTIDTVDLLLYSVAANIEAVQLHMKLTDFDDLHVLQQFRARQGPEALQFTLADINQQLGRIERLATTGSRDDAVRSTFVLWCIECAAAIGLTQLALERTVGPKARLRRADEALRTALDSDIPQINFDREVLEALSREGEDDGRLSALMEEVDKAVLDTLNQDTYEASVAKQRRLGELVGVHRRIFGDDLFFSPHSARVIDSNIKKNEKLQYCFLGILYHTARYLRLYIKLYILGTEDIVNGVSDLNVIGEQRRPGDHATRTTLTADELTDTHRGLIHSLYEARDDAHVLHRVEHYLRHVAKYGAQEHVAYVCKKPRYGFFQT